MRVVRFVFALLVIASALEIVDDQRLVAEDSPAASAAESLRSLRSGRFEVGPLDELGDLVDDARKIGDPFRMAAEGLE